MSVYSASIALSRDFHNKVGFLVQTFDNRKPYGFASSFIHATLCQLTIDVKDYRVF